jgi:hypothetical protein
VVVAIDGPRSVVEELRTHGLHFGFLRNAEGVDKGLARVAASGYPSEMLSAWLSTLLWEVASMRGRITAVWSPGMDYELLKRVHAGRVVTVHADSAEAALAELADHDLARTFATSHVCLLRGDRQTAQNAVGFHRGYWIDPESGFDRGIVSAAEGDQVAGLREWSKHTFEEAERMQCVPLVWHPRITASDCRAAWPERTVVEVRASSPEELNEKWSVHVH